MNRSKVNLPHQWLQVSPGTALSEELLFLDPIKYVTDSQTQKMPEQT